MLTISLFPQASRSIIVMNLMIITCLVAPFSCASTDPFSFSWDVPVSLPVSVYSGGGTIDVDRTSQTPGISNSLYVYGHNSHRDDASSKLVTVEIEVSEAGVLEPCSGQSNKLEVESPAAHSAGNTTNLICGNEIVEFHLLEIPFFLTFLKGSGPTISQLNKFKIIINKWSDSGYYDKHVNVQSRPGVLLSPLYPVSFSGFMSANWHLMLEPGHAAFIQFRYIHMQQVETVHCPNRIEISGGNDLTQETFCSNQLTTTAVKPLNHQDGISLKFKSYSVSQQTPQEEPYGFELEYRSVKIASEQACDRKIQVKEATLFTSTPARQTNCKITFSPMASQALALTSLSAGSYAIPLTCLSHSVKVSVKVSVGGKELPQVDCDQIPFGTIRAPPGQDVVIDISGGGYDGKEVGFIVEALDPDTFPETVNAHIGPSYVWTPRSSRVKKNALLKVRSPVSSCVEFSALNKSFKLKSASLSSIVSLFSGSGDDGIFELTRNCLGITRKDAAINNGLQRITTVFEKSTAAFWFRISHIGFKPCDLPSTPLEIRSIDSIYSLFQRWEVSKNMACKFVLNPDNTGYRPTSGVKFRGRLEKMENAKLYVEYDQDKSYVMADFGNIPVEKDKVSEWFSSRDPISIFFMTGNDVSTDMATFEYAARYGTDDLYTSNAACPGPLVFSASRINGDSLSTPNYGLFYMEPNTTCSWTIKRLFLPNYYIYVSIANLDLPCNSTTKLFIKGSEEQNDLSNLVCDKQYYRRVFHKDVDIKLIGGPDHVTKGIQFHAIAKELEYGQHCNVSRSISSADTHLTVTGTLVYGLYFLPFICKIHVQSSNQNRLDVVIKKLNIADDLDRYDCFNNGLTVYDGLTTESRTLLHTCAQEDVRVTSSSKYVTIAIAVRDKIYQPLTFNLYVKWHDYGACYGAVKKVFANANHQHLVWPGQGSLYPSEAVCRWDFVSKDGDPVEVVANHLNMEVSRGCKYDYLEIFDGAHSLGRICGQTARSSVYRSSGSTLTIQFYSDGAKEGYGFDLVYYTQEVASKGAIGGMDSNDDDDDDDDDESSDSNNKTGVIIGACLSVIVGVFGLGVMCVWLVHKKRVRDQRHRQRRRREMAAQYINNNQESSVYVINPLIVNNTAPPPSYSGLINQGFMEEPPPSYLDALRQLSSSDPPPPPGSATTGSDQASREPPPPYALSIPRGHAAILEEEEAAEPAPLYDSLSTTPRSRLDEGEDEENTPSNNSNHTESSPSSPNTLTCPSSLPQGNAPPFSTSSSDSLSPQINNDECRSYNQAHRSRTLSDVAARASTQCNRTDVYETIQPGRILTYSGGSLGESGSNPVEQTVGHGESLPQSLNSGLPSSLPDCLEEHANVPEYRLAAVSSENVDIPDAAQTQISPTLDYSIAHHPDVNGRDVYNLAQHCDGSQNGEYSLAQCGSDSDNWDQPTDNERAGAGDRNGNGYDNGGRGEASHRMSHDRRAPRQPRSRNVSYNNEGFDDDEGVYSLARHPDETGRARVRSDSDSDNCDGNFRTGQGRRRSRNNSDYEEVQTNGLAHHGRRGGREDVDRSHAGESRRGPVVGSGGHSPDRRHNKPRRNGSLGPL